MPRIIIQITLLVVLTASAAGCQRYVETPTPPGQVASPIQPIKAEPYRNDSTAAADALHRSEQGASVLERSPLNTQKKAKPLMNPAIIGSFQKAYKQAGKPRLAVFFNRSLSDEVRQWRTNSRIVASLEGKLEEESDNARKSFKSSGDASVYAQTYIHDSARTSPDESWMWRFEDGFLSSFLKSGASVVDRATILRLTTAELGTQSSAYDPLAVKNIEMKALTDKADLFIEILIRYAPETELGYEFKATAKDVSTGFIRAIVTSFDWEYDTTGENREKVTATSYGYEFVKETEKIQLPEIKVVSRDLALALMQSLASNWR